MVFKSNIHALGAQPLMKVAGLGQETGPSGYFFGGNGYCAISSSSAITSAGCLASWPASTGRRNWPV